LNKVKLWWGGYGLKAKNLIKNGTFIIEYCGELVDRAEAEKRLNESSKIGVTNYYLLSLDKVSVYLIFRLQEAVLCT
jgi:SET domain-containing protein